VPYKRRRKMERELVSNEELVSILNEKLSKYEECENCRFNGIIELAEEDKEGCNWSTASSIITCSDGGTEICYPYAARVVSEVGKKYNIKK
jgi:hypothetical protein